MKILKCERCNKPHDIEVDGGVCLSCDRVVCGLCSQWEEARQQRECRTCEYRLSNGQGTWTSYGAFMCPDGVDHDFEERLASNVMRNTQKA